jgi:glutamate 5-kinase
MGAVVNIRSAGGEVIARGLTEYSSDDLLKIKGRKTAEIAALLGTKDYDEVIHRDHMLVFVRNQAS